MPGIEAAQAPEAVTEVVIYAGPCTDEKMIELREQEPLQERIVANEFPEDPLLPAPYLFTCLLSIMPIRFLEKRQERPVPIDRAGRVTPLLVKACTTGNPRQRSLESSLFVVDGVFLLKERKRAGLNPETPSQGKAISVGVGGKAFAPDLV